MNNTTLGLSAATMFLASCATQTTLAPLHEAQLACQVQHNANACNALPLLQANATEEANHNALLAAGLVLLLPLAILAASPPEPDVIIIHRY